MATVCCMPQLFLGYQQWSKVEMFNPSNSCWCSYVQILRNLVHQVKHGETISMLPGHIFKYFKPAPLVLVLMVEVFTQFCQ